MSTEYVATVTVKGQVVIPIELRRKFGIEPGTKLRFSAEEDVIVVQPLTADYYRSLRGSLPDKRALGQLLEDRAAERDR